MLVILLGQNVSITLTSKDTTHHHHPIPSPAAFLKLSSHVDHQLPHQPLVPSLYAFIVLIEPSLSQAPGTS